MRPYPTRLAPHQTHSRTRIGCLAGVLLLIAGTAHGQLPERFKSLDADGDGKISRQEFPAGDSLFSQLDANHDGFIDAEEAQKAWDLLRAKKGQTAKAAGKGERAQAALPDDVELTADVAYKKVGDEPILLDLYGLRGKHYEHAPLAVFIHGGGYVGGSKQGLLGRLGDIFLPLMREHGYRVASLNYRLCTPTGPKLVDCSTDCKDAIRFLVRNAAAYGIDPQRIATMGTSAGGSLSLLQALTKDDDLPGDPQLAGAAARARCAVAWFGATDFTNSDLRSELDPKRIELKMPILFKSAPDKDPHEYESVSPVWYMQRNGLKPPILLVHGDHDTTAPPQQSAWMDQQAQKLGVPLKYVVVTNAGHGFKEAGGPVSPSVEEIHKLTLNFFLENNP